MQKGNTYRAKTGNIKTMVTSLLNTQEATLPTLQNNYTYDQLNRIVNYDGYTANGLAYHTDYSYDRNGNLKTLNRKVGNNHFDKLGYSYTPNTNQLTVVSDTQGNQPATSGIIDLPNPVEALRKLNIDPNKNPTHNYIYDEIGQLVEDRTEGLVIDWRVDGKVKSVTKTKNTTTTTDDTFITFEYDGLGNRVAKTVNYPGDDTQPGNVKHTYYTRDAQGNVMAVYQTGEPVVITPKDELQLTGAINTDQQALQSIVLTNAEVANQNPTKVIVSEAGEITMRSGTIHPGGQLKVCPVTEIETDEILPGLALTEQHIYGSSRLGVQEPRGIVFGVNDTNTTPAKNVIGDKRYELTNHLGNVLSVISDERNGNKPDVIAFNDYYPFGMLLPNRHGSSDKYRYGFQGQEKDDELKGEGNSLNYKYRMHDPRVSRFFAVDPLTGQYPHYTPYSFSGNKVISHIELEGLEEFIAITNRDWRWRYYRVQKGDNLEQISKTTGVAINSILGYNKDIEDANLIYPNQIIDLNGGNALTVGDFTFDTKQSNWAKDFFVELATTNENGPSFQSSVKTVMKAAPAATMSPMSMFSFTGLSSMAGRGVLSAGTDMLISKGKFNAVGVAVDMFMTPGAGALVGSAFEVNINPAELKVVETRSVLSGTKTLGEFGTDLGSSLLFGGRENILTKYASDAGSLGSKVIEAANTITSKSVSEGVKSKLPKKDQ